MKNEKLNTLLRILSGDFPKTLKATGISNTTELVAIFIESKKFIQFKNDQIKNTTLGNFNYLIAQRFYEAKLISKKQLQLQKSMFGYKIGGWTFETLKKYNVSSLGEVVDRCIDKDGSFKPLGGKDKAIASNYEIAKILHREGFLSEKQFLLVVRPSYRYRQLTDVELKDTDDTSIDITSWPKETQRLIVILYNRRHCVSWDRYLHRNRRLGSVSLKFLAKEFLRVPPHSDLPEFKTCGFFLHKLFETEWIENLEKNLSIIRDVLREHNLVT